MRGEGLRFGEVEHDRMVGLLHAAALGEGSWETTMGEIAGRFASGAVVFNIRDPENRVMAVENFSPHTRAFALEYYAGELMAKDPRTPILYGLPAGQIYYDHALFDPTEMLADRWCREACDVLGVTYQLGATLRLPGGLNGAFAILHNEDEGHASEAAIQAFRRLAPHIEQAFVLGLVIEREAATRSALLEALTVRADGVILLGADGRPTFMNDAASVILGAGDGLSLLDGVLTARRPPETRQMRRLVANVVGGWAVGRQATGGRVLVSRPSGAPAYVVSVVAAPASERFLGGRTIAGIVHLHDLGAKHLPSREAMASVFGLSDRESDLALELVRRADLAQAATGAGMALNTARNHLQSILRKTGARSQAGLLQILGRLP